MKVKTIIAGFIVILATLTIWQIVTSYKNNKTPTAYASKKINVQKPNHEKTPLKNEKTESLSDSYYDQIAGKVNHVREGKWITVKGLSVKVNHSYYTKTQKGWEDLVEGQPDLDTHKRIIGHDTYLVVDATFKQKKGTKSLGFSSFDFTSYYNKYKDFSMGTILTSSTYFSKYLTEEQRHSDLLLVTPLKTGKSIRTKFIFVLEDKDITSYDYPFFHIALSSGCIKNDRPEYHGLIYLEPEDRR